MAFSKAMPEAFCVTLFKGSYDNDEVKKPHIFICKVSIAQLLAKQLCVVVCCVMCVLAKSCKLHSIVQDNLGGVTTTTTECP